MKPIRRRQFNTVRGKKIPERFTVKFLQCRQHEPPLSAESPGEMLHIQRIGNIAFAAAGS